MLTGCFKPEWLKLWWRYEFGVKPSLDCKVIGIGIWWWFCSLCRWWAGWSIFWTLYILKWCIFWFSSRIRGRIWVDWPAISPVWQKIALRSNVLSRGDWICCVGPSRCERMTPVVAPSVAYWPAVKNGFWYACMLDLLFASPPAIELLLSDCCMYSE